MKSDSLYYIHKDYQGKIEIITNDMGHELEILSFDPWGRRRNANTWEYDVNIKPQHFDRGYTMHEHHDVFGLINMPAPTSKASSGNGRVYDPWVGRMLSPDPFIQDPTNTQNYNRYSYALNNPLKYTDPSGYHHASVFKPGDWNAGISSGGALYLNTFFTNGMANRYDFSGANGAANDYYGITNDQNGYLVENTPTYDQHSGYYRDQQGNIVGYSEVFSNFVEPNSVLSAQGSSAQNIYEGITSGLSYYTVEANGNTELISAYGGLGSSVISKTGAVGFTNPTAAVHLGAFGVAGSTGGGVPGYVGDAVGAGSLGAGTLQTVFRHSDPAAPEMLSGDNNKTNTVYI